MLVFSSAAFAQEKSEKEAAKVDYRPGNLNISGSVGFGYGFSLTLYPGIELFLAESELDDGIHLDFGLAGKGLYNHYSYGYTTGDWGWTSYAAGAFGTAHISFLNFDDMFDYLSRMDFYGGIGLVYNYFDYFGPYDSYSYLDYSGLRLATVGGTNFYLTDRIAIIVEGVYWGYSGGTVGILYKM